MSSGMFITFEGIDGCGKSTQIRKLAEHIFKKDKHHHVLLTREPYKDTNIRKVITEDDDPYTAGEKLADLFIADRKNHAEELIKPFLAKGHFVVSDRYKLSTITYQTAQGLAMDDLIARHEGLPVPDMTFIIDLSPEEAQRRMKNESVVTRGKEHRFEAQLSFSEKLRENHRIAQKILSEKGEKIFVIDGHRTPEEIFNEIREIFDRECH